MEQIRNYCLSKPGVTEGFPFGGSTLVFKAGGKMYALTDIDDFQFINLKCDPERAIELREGNPGIRPGYHMSKTHWNSVYVDGSVPDPLIFELIDHSYDLIIQSLPAKIRNEIK